MKKYSIHIIFLILLIATIITIYISPENWLPPILFLIVSVIAIIDSKYKKKLKIIIFIIIFILIFILKKMNLTDSILLFI